MRKQNDSSTSLGLIDPSRLALIPPSFRSQHEFCFYIHDAMVTLLQEAESVQASAVTFTLQDEKDGELLEQAADPIVFLLNTGRRDVARRVVINQTNLALFADLLHFICEALHALEKRKFAVTFALLRKPLKQSLMFATWMCADEEDFFEQIKRSPADYMEEKDLPPERRLHLLRSAMKFIKDPANFNADLIHDIVYRKDLENGLAPLFDKAAHLVTSRGQLMRTEELNLNFIFHHPEENDTYSFVYVRLAYILMYLLFLQIALYDRMYSIQKSFVDWMLLTAVGAYEALFGNGRSKLLDTLNDQFATLLRCPHCNNKLTITKPAAARFFVSQELYCSRCKSDHQFPLFWILSQSQWSCSTIEEQLKMAF